MHIQDKTRKKKRKKMIQRMGKKRKRRRKPTKTTSTTSTYAPLQLQHTRKHFLWSFPPSLPPSLLPSFPLPLEAILHLPQRRHNPGRVLPIRPPPLPRCLDDPLLAHPHKGIGFQLTPHGGRDRVPSLLQGGGGPSNFCLQGGVVGLDGQGKGKV